MLEVIRSDGPGTALASRPGVGLDSGETFRYRTLRSDVGEQHRVRLETVDVLIEPDMCLSYAVFPAWSDEPDGSTPSGGFESTAVTVDLEFEDGSRLSESSQLVDQAGFRCGVADQYASRSLTIDQWNLKVIRLDGLAGRRVVGIDCVTIGVLDTRGEHETFVRRTPTGWLSDIRIEPRPRVSSALPPSELVDTRRGTHSSSDASRGNTIPAVAVPHGFNFAIPVTDAESSYTWPYRYHQDRLDQNASALQAFALSHSPSPWMGDRGIVHIMPTLDGVDANAGRNERRMTFRHANETAHPHLYRVLFDNGVVGELTATDHVVLMRFTVPRGGGIIIDQPDDRGALEIEPGHARAQLTGYTDSRFDRVPANQPRMYFAATIDRPVIARRMAAVPERPNVSAALSVDAGPSETFTLRIATSFISVDQALSSLDLEAPVEMSFDDIVSAAQAQWDARLGVIAVENASEDQLVTLTSCLYRLFLYPNNATENAGTAIRPRWVHADTANPPKRAHTPRHTGCDVRDGHSYVNNGFWDTYRTAWPAYSLLDSAHAAHLLDGFVEHFRSSDWMARWAAPGPADCMVGTSSDLVIADAIASGVVLEDPEAAYDSALRNATTPSPSCSVGRIGNDRAIFRGYVPTSIPEGLSWTLESSINDFGIARISKHLADSAPAAHPRRREFSANARYFRSRALGYASMFDPEIGFFVGKHEDGRLRSTSEPYDPAVWGGDYTETNGWGMAFTAPHDGNGLATLHGGRDALESKLDAYFTTEETAAVEVSGSYGRVIHEMREARDIRMGMFGLSNQPAHHIPYMYYFTGAPHKGQAIVRESIARLFLGSEIGQGYPGDEDNGEMSAWYVFSAIGLYPLTPGSGELLISSPSFRETSIRFPDGNVAQIIAHEFSVENVYIQSVAVNGDPWPKTSIPIAVIRRGARIEITLGPEPSTWGSGPADGPYSLSRLGELPRPERDLTDPTAATHRARASSGAGEAVFDDSSSTSLPLSRDEWVAYEFPEAVTPGFYTITLAARSETAEWLLEASDDGATWREVDRRAGERFKWDRQTRPFVPDDVPAAKWWRIRAGAYGLNLSQLEFCGHQAATR